ncbi:MAG: recombinase family protein, partial [Clostridia bacterium]|nr:recombinase family protein [Clostridia bacterium]
PETTLKEACAQVLGLAVYDAESVENRIEQIEAMPGNILVFHLNDGTTHEVAWTFPSRAESWTDEMRQKAAEQMRRRYAETGH